MSSYVRLTGLYPPMSVSTTSRILWWLARKATSKPSALRTGRVSHAAGVAMTGAWFPPILSAIWIPPNPGVARCESKVILDVLDLLHSLPTIMAPRASGPLRAR